MFEKVVTELRREIKHGRPSLAVARELDKESRAMELKSRTILQELTLMTASMITIIGTTAIAASLPQMSDAFSGTQNSQFLVKLSLTIPALSAALSGPFTGLMVDRWGRKRPFIAALIVYGLAGMSGFFLTSLYAILASRFILGITVAAITTCATTLIADYSDRAKLQSFMGRQSLFMAAGNVLFVSFSGVLANHNWRWPFLIYTIAFIILVGVVFLIAEPNTAVNTEVVTLRKKDETPPILKMTFVYSIGFINMVIYFMVPVYLPFYLQTFPYSNSVKVGALLALVGLSWGISSSQYCRLAKILSFEWITVTAFALMGLAYLLLASAPNYPVAVLALILIGLGLGAVVPNLNAWLLSFTPASLKGRAVGVLIFFVFIGQFLSPVITQPLSSTTSIANSYMVAGLVLALIALGSAVYRSGCSQKRKKEVVGGAAAGKTARTKV